jgi:uncharacterized protein
MSRINSAKKLLKKLLDSSNIDAGHGIDHALIVVSHARKALIHENNLDDNTKECILLASLLHDADDHKFFPNNKSNENATAILKDVGVHDQGIKLILQMIDLVSCSKNRNSIVDPRWLLIPRYCDRLEAMGKIGIQRAKEYTIHTHRPFYTKNTPRATTLSELNAIATPERFLNYCGESESMMDHLYDKVLHIHEFHINNKYLQDIAKKRHLVLVKYCLDFGRGKLNL